MQTPNGSLNIYENKKRLVIQALNCMPTIGKAAIALGISERSLYSYIKAFDIKKQGRQYCSTDTQTPHAAA